jgi:predicted dehydrogenase
MPEKIKIGLIGCGGIARNHLYAFRELYRKGLGNFEIVAICDVVDKKAKSFASDVKKFQKKTTPKVHRDFDNMLEKEDIQAVHICTDHRTHHLIAIPCLKKGKHVIVEKPLGITMRAGRRMIEAAKKHGKVLAVAEDRRFLLINRASKWAIEQGYIGDVQMVLQIDVGGAPNFGRDLIVVGTPWRHRKLEGGAGTALDNGCHDIDTFRSLNGEIDEATGLIKTFEKTRVNRNEKGETVEKVKCTTEDAGFAILKFHNGSIGHWAPAYWAGHGEASSIGRWIYGSKGCLKNEWMVLDNGQRENVTTLYLLNADKEEKERYFPKGITNAFALETYNFLEAIREHRKPEVDGLEGLKDEAVCYAVIESSCLDRPVKVKDVLDGVVENYQKEINKNLGLS